MWEVIAAFEGQGRENTPSGGWGGGGEKGDRPFVKDFQIERVEESKMAGSSCFSFPGSRGSCI